MIKTIKQQKSVKPTKMIFVWAMMIVFSLSLVSFEKVEAALTNQLDLGERGSDVSELQSFLARDRAIYPEGLVTGYFGQLTKAAVERFQTAQGIVSQGTPVTTGYGRVGPITMARINSLLGGWTGGSGGFSGGADKSSPSIYSLSLSTTNSSATFNWNTTENSSAVIYYGTSLIYMVEANANMGVTINSNWSLLVHSDLRTSHSANLTGLQPNTTYNYVVYVRDGSGNESLTWPATFRTN